MKTISTERWNDSKADRGLAHVELVLTELDEGAWFFKQKIKNDMDCSNGVFNSMLESIRSNSFALEKILFRKNLILSSRSMYNVEL